jgi:hypothetical protein
VAVEPGLSERLRTTPALAQANLSGIKTQRAAIVAVAGRLIRLRWLVVLLSSGLILGPAAAQDHQRAPVPGAVDPHVTQATIHDTICQRGYTTQVRPPRKVTDAIKRRLANGLPGSPQDYELDHLIPLGLGGHPTSPNNLWLQNWSEAAMKDRDELRLHREVCAGRMTLEQAHREMVTRWGPRE